jgi:hypothetical protein
MLRITTVIVLIALTAAALGCGKGTTTQGTLYNVTISRELEAYEPRDLDAVHQAAVKAVEAMGYSIDKQAIDVREGLIEGRTALDRTVRIKSFKTGDEVTRITVYVGGDEQAAREVLDKIETAVK